MVRPGDFEDCGDVSVSQPDGKVGDALGSTGTALEEVASGASLRNPGFPGSAGGFREFLKLRVLLSGNFHKNKMQATESISVFFKSG